MVMDAWLYPELARLYEKEKGKGSQRQLHNEAQAALGTFSKIHPSAEIREFHGIWFRGLLLAFLAEVANISSQTEFPFKGRNVFAILIWYWLWSSQTYVKVAGAWVSQTLYWQYSIYILIKTNLIMKDLCLISFCYYTECYLDARICEAFISATTCRK